MNIHLMGKNHKRHLAMKTQTTCDGGQISTKASVYNKETKRWERNDNIKITQQKAPPLPPDHLFCQICKEKRSKVQIGRAFSQKACYSCPLVVHSCKIFFHKL